MPLSPVGGPASFIRWIYINPGPDWIRDPFAEKYDFGRLFDFRRRWSAGLRQICAITAILFENIQLKSFFL
jgi:hypothetical protein